MKKSLFDVLRYRDLRLFLLGCFLSFTGSYMQTVGIGWHIYTLTHSAYFLGLLGIVGFAPSLLSFLPAGVIVDIHHKKDILLASEGILAAVAFFLFLVTFLGIVNVWIIFALLFCNSLIYTIEGAARQATVPLLVSQNHLSQALSLQTLARQIGAVVGPALAGFVIAFYGVGSIYLYNAISFALFFILLLFIAVPVVKEKAEITKEMVFEGIRFIKNNSLIATTMLLDFFATFFAGAMVLLPVFAKDVYHVNAQELGFLYAAPSLGAMLAGFYLSSQTKIRHQGKVLLTAVLVYAVGTIGFGLSHIFFLGFFFLAVLGAGDMVSTVIRNVIRQELTPATLRGRVLSVVALFYMGGPYLGDAEAGFVAGILGAPASVVIGGVVTFLLTALIAWKIPRLRNFDGHTSQ